RGDRDQHRDRRGRAGHRLRHSNQYGQAGDRPARGQGQGRPRLARRLAAASVDRARPEPGAVEHERRGRRLPPPGRPRRHHGRAQGDVIISYNKIPVEDYRHVQRLVAESAVGKTVTLEVLRKKQKIDVPVTVAEVPDTTPRKPEGPSPGG